MIEQLIKDITILLQDGDFVKAEEKCKELESKQLSDQKKFLLYDFKNRIYSTTGRLEMAEASLRDQLALAQKIYPPNDITLSLILRNLTMVLDLQQKYSEAIPYGEQSLAILRNTLPASDLRIADGIVSLAKQHYELGRFKQAQELLNEAKNLYETHAEHHSLGVATCLNNLGRIQEHLGDRELAINLYKESVQIRRDLLGKHQDTAFVLLNLGTALADLGQHKEAVQALIESRNIYLALNMDDSPYIQTCRDKIMDC